MLPNLMKVRIRQNDPILAEKRGEISKNPLGRISINQTLGYGGTDSVKLRVQTFSPNDINLKLNCKENGP